MGAIILDINRELSLREYIMRENEDFHAPYGPEFDFYIAVREGDTEKVKQLCSVDFAEKIGFGRLSDNKLQNIKYHFVVTAALVARYCIEGGMPHEKAYSLSDLYIRRADRCYGIPQISALHTEMVMEYTARMNAIRKERIFSKPIVACVEYIYNNLHKRIYIAELAKLTHLDRCYLSRLFKKETGMPVTEYVLSRKIEAAQNMLKYSEYSLSEIAFILCFPNQSYFTSVFKKRVGYTPKKYRDSCSRKIDIRR